MYWRILTPYLWILHCRNVEGVEKQEGRGHLRNDRLSRVIVADMKVVFKPTNQNGKGKNPSRMYFIESWHLCIMLLIHPIHVSFTRSRLLVDFIAILPDFRVVFICKACLFDWFSLHCLFWSLLSVETRKSKTKNLTFLWWITLHTLVTLFHLFLFSLLVKFTLNLNAIYYATLRTTWYEVRTTHSQWGIRFFSYCSIWHTSKFWYLAFKNDVYIINGMPLSVSHNLLPS